MAEIGARLREARMRARIDINEVEVRTKIRAKYLRAIENEEWNLLPGEVYAKSFLRTYGNYLGLDTRQLLDEFRRQYESPSDYELRPAAPLGRDRERNRRLRGPRIPSWLPIVVVLVAVVVVLYVVGSNTGTNKPSSSGTHAAVHHPHKTSAKHIPSVLAHRPSKVKLQLIPTGQVYVCLVNGVGKQLIPGLIYGPGQTIPVKSAPKLLLTLGNNAVQMKINGVPVNVTASAGAIGYELLPGSHHLLPAAQQPRCT